MKSAIGAAALAAEAGRSFAQAAQDWSLPSKAPVRMIENTFILMPDGTQRGSRIRAALSESLWPQVWPSPKTPTLLFHLGGARVDLPVRPRPVAAAPMPIALAPPLPSGPKTWPRMELERRDGAVRVGETWPLATQTVADIAETISGAGPNVVLTMTEGDPSSCVWKAEQSSRYKRPGWDVQLTSQISLSATPAHFTIEERIAATLNQEPVADVRTTKTIPRVLM